MSQHYANLIAVVEALSDTGITDADLTWLSNRPEDMKAAATAFKEAIAAARQRAAEAHRKRQEFTHMAVWSLLLGDDDSLPSDAERRAFEASLASAGVTHIRHLLRKEREDLEPYLEPMTIDMIVERLERHGMALGENKPKDN